MKKITINHILKLKGGKHPFATLTAYDYTSARIVDETGIPLILVGDSAAMVMLGYENTLPVTVDEMIMLTAAVCRGVRHALVVADLPFMSYQASVGEALRTAGRFIKETGASGVKLEGGVRMAPQIRALVENGIPVMGHIGLTPQSFHQFSGYRIQGKTLATARQLLQDAQAVESAGAFSLVLEGVPSQLAEEITRRVSIPTIGIAAGPHCDGQIQVFHDILGLFGTFVPKHTKRFARLGEAILNAVSDYKNEVEEGRFPSEEHQTRLSSKIIEELQKPPQ